jgi:hypothetical protein
MKARKRGRHRSPVQALRRLRRPSAACNITGRQKEILTGSSLHFHGLDDNAIRSCAQHRANRGDARTGKDERAQEKTFHNPHKFFMRRLPS